MRERLERIVGPDRVITESAALGEYRDDYTEADGQDPTAVVMIETADELQQLVQVAPEIGASITPRIANTNIGGIAIPAPGGIVADLTRMNRILEVDADEMYAVIEPGVTQIQLKEHLEKLGVPLTFGFSLGPPHVSILANCILDGLTNRSLKYGSMSQWLSGIEVILGDGTMLRTGSWAMEGIPPFGRVPMPDLTGMFTAFQGTTGLVTKGVFQLWPKHREEKRLFILGYDSDSVFTAMQSLCWLEICEDVGVLSWPNGKMMMGVPHPDPVPDPDEPKYFLYVDLAADLPEQMALKERMISSVLDELRDQGATFESPLDVQTLLKVNPAMGVFADFPVDLKYLYDHEGGGLSWMGTYGPISRFATCADACSALMVERGYPPAIVSRPMRGGHFGVLRFLVTFDHADDDERARVRELMRVLLDEVTGRGFAMYKTPDWAMDVLRERIDPRMRELVRQVKKLTDPHGILNPGKLMM